MDMSRVLGDSPHPTSICFFVGLRLAALRELRYTCTALVVSGPETFVIGDQTWKGVNSWPNRAWQVWRR